MILVVTHDQDAHGRHMIELLHAKDQEIHVLDYSRFPSEIEITFKIKNASGITFRLPDGIQIKGSSVVSVLNRRQSEPKPLFNLQNQEIREYIIRESRHFLDVLPQILPVFWLNNPNWVRIANRKPYQLIVARSLGFLIPETIVTNSPGNFERFIQSTCIDIAAKALFTPGISIKDTDGEHHLSLYTTRLIKDSALKEARRVKNCPTIFQAYVEKTFELRITVVGEQVFACAIYSQVSEKTRVDWRNYDLANTPHEPYVLPKDIERRCVGLCRKLNLDFGCIDMIVTPENQYVFLEINPSGQWLWIEHLTKMPISEAIAELLINPPKRDS